VTDLQPKGSAGPFASARSFLRSSTFVRDAGTLGLSQAVALCVAVVQGVVVARILGPHSYGAVALIVAVPALIYVFFDIRSQDVAVRYLAEFAGSGRNEAALAFYRLTIVADLTASGLALAVVALLSPWASGRVVGDSTVALLLVVHSFGIVCRAPAIASNAVMMTLGLYKTLATLTVSVSLVRAALVISLVAAGLGVAGAIVGSAVALAIEGVLLLAVGTRASQLAWQGSWARARFAPLRPRSREILRFLFWSDVGSLLGLFTKQFDVVVIGYFAGPTQAGYYRLAKSVGSLPGVFVSPLQNVTYQRFVQLRTSRDPAALRSELRHVVGKVAGPLAALTFLSIPFVPLAMDIVAGPRYAPAASAAQILVGLSAVWMLTLWLKPAALTLGAVHAWALTAGLTALLSVAGFLLVTPFLGFEGTALVRFGASTLGQLVLIVHLARRYRGERLSQTIVGS
jgi:O-antigen/teichoic acid export membrane protein